MNRRSLRLLLIGLVLVVILAVGVSWWASGRQEAVILGELSTEGQQRLATAEFQRDGQGQTLRLDGPTTATIETECFRFSVPQTIYYAKTEKKAQGCVFRGALAKPRKVQVAITRESFTQAVSNLADLPSIRLRQKNPQTYQPIEVSATTSQSALGFRSDQEVALFMQHQTEVLTVSLYDTAVMDDELVSVAQEMMKAFSAAVDQDPNKQ